VNPFFKPTPALDRGVLVAAVYDRRRFCDTSCPAVIHLHGSAARQADRCYSRHRSCSLCRVVSTIITLFIVSCANFAPPPGVSPALIANARPDQVGAEQLQGGRRLFVSRCLECHTLPRITKYNREQWPHLVSRMSGRASLSASEQAAIVAYLRAASVSTR
jgi:cytochrome c1